ncbi:MAG TPA: ATP-grasp domain-containing protein, partial [Longimicrobiaceae bacterium]|nr:ATP-grasp domain-containing protein [Longimicrobiaceae bacterium]
CRVAAVLVTDGEQRAALAAVRSLAAAGHTVFVCSPRSRSLAGASRHCRAHAPVPDPLTEPAAFVAAVRGLIRRNGVDVLLPITEPSLLALLPERETLGALLPFAGLAEFERICDKGAVMEAARAVGIGVPAQLRVESVEEARAVDPGALRFPLVLKPSRSVVSANGKRAKSSVVHLRDGTALRSALDALPPGAYPVLLQERIVGPGVGIFVLLWEGEVVAAFSHRRIREKPPSGGVSVYRESHPLDPALLERSVALLRAFGWQGVAMVEYKLDAATGKAYIMEINGRFWGSLQLALDAGVDFPALLLQAAAGARPAPVTSYRTGVRLRWTLGEVDHLIARMRRSREELALPEDAPGLGGAVAQFVAAFGPGRRGEVFRASDPGPALREALDWLRGR